MYTRRVFAILYGAIVMSEKCHVADQFCTAAPNVEGAKTRAICFLCGLPVCTRCSSKRRHRWYRKLSSRTGREVTYETAKGIVRMCNVCQAYLDGSEKVVDKRMKLMAEK